jgi:sensor histidine kinase YesM
MLILEIVNNFNPRHTKEKIGSGIGLENVKRRLEKIYQEKFSMNCDFVDVDKFIAQIKIPINN